MECKNVHPEIFISRQSQMQENLPLRQLLKAFEIFSHTLTALQLTEKDFLSQ
jgi:hypothetical protein